MIAVVAAHVVAGNRSTVTGADFAIAFVCFSRMTVVVPACRWQSIDRDRVSTAPFSTARCFIQQKLERESASAIVFVCFSRIKNAKPN